MELHESGQFVVLSQEDFSKIKANPNFTVIGFMREESAGMHLITRADTKIALTAQGWNAISN